MLRRNSSLPILLALLLVAPSANFAAAPAAESLLPQTTKGFLSIADVDEMLAKWNETQLGQLMNDPIMKPFADDLRRQIEDKFAKTGIRLGLTWEDLEGVYGGEVCFAMIQPEGDIKQHAMAMLVDVTDHHQQAQQLLEKVSGNLKGRNAKREVRQIGNHNVVVYTLPKEKGEIETHQACYLIVEKQNLLLATDHLGAIRDVIGRLEGQIKKPLSDLVSFVAVKRQLTAAAGNNQPHIHWFVEPFGYIQFSRAALGGRKRRGTDLLKVLSNQGFGAILGVGGHVNFSTDRHEVLHRTYIHAPPVARAPGEINTSRFNLAARMLNFPPTNGESLKAQSWIPRNAASYLTFNWKMQDAFKYVDTLVDELAGEEGTFKDVLKGLLNDPNGPQIDVKKELIDHLAERATLLTDYRMPVTTTSERRMFAIQLANVAAVRKTLDKAMSTDPNANKHIFGKDQIIIWEILDKDDSEDVSTELVIDGPGFGPFLIEEEEEVAQANEPQIPNIAVTVAHGHLIIASHLDFVVDMLKEAKQPNNLVAAADYKLVYAALDQLGAGSDSFRSFARTDESFRPTYEMLRQGKMPQSDSIMARILNRLLGSDEEGVTREQQIDGSKMPEFQAVRRYLGPAGLYARPIYAQQGSKTEIGWLVVGCLLTKEAVANQKQPVVNKPESKPILVGEAKK